MNTQNNILFAALLISLYTASNYTSSWPDFDALEQQIEQQMKAMRQMHQQCTQPPFWSAPHQQSISLDTTNKNATITLSNIDGENVEARLNDTNNGLSITTPTKKFIISTNGNILAIKAQEVMHSQQEKKEGGIAQFHGTSKYQSQCSVHGKLLLEKHTIDYNPDKKELIIVIPFAQVSNGKIVPINKLKPQSSQPTEVSLTASQPSEK